MGRESASYYLSVPPELEDAVLVALREGGAEPAGAEHTWIELRLRDPHRYWIDLRVHRAAEPLLEIRIALTNDEWSIRAPLEAAFTALPAAAAQRPLRDEDGAELGAPAQGGWSRRLEQDYGRRRAEFVDRVGDVNAPISADHVYLYIHQAGWRRDDDLDLEWQRDREISRIEKMWHGDRQVPPGHPDRAGQAGRDEADGDAPPRGG
ncbi:MAG: hypothetical protein QOG42_1575 [Solirubrobacteraceae bacterium]|jgi:hypothetical protein|nr:hypothetical protein [Solirubrobacteraceae bacterium]